MTLENEIDEKSKFECFQNQQVKLSSMIATMINKWLMKMLTKSKIKWLIQKQTLKGAVCSPKICRWLVAWS